MPQGIAHHPVASCRIAENSRLAIVLLYTTGLRLGELVRLTFTLGDYDAREHTQLIRDSKISQVEAYAALD